MESIVAMAGADLGFQKEMCNSCVMIVGPSGSVIAKVVSQCPQCPPGTLMLGIKSAAKIDKNFKAANDGQAFPASWLPVPCDRLDANRKNSTSTNQTSARDGDKMKQGSSILSLLPKMDGKLPKEFADLSGKELVGKAVATRERIPMGICRRPVDFSKPIPYLALNALDFTPELCEKCALIKGRRGEIKAKIVHVCEECPPNTMVLGFEAANIVQGGINDENFVFNVQWKLVNC